MVEGAVWGGRPERPTLVLVLDKVGPYGQQMDFNPASPKEKRRQPKQVSVL